VTVISAVGCDDRQPAAEEVFRRDSAGIEIVQNGDVGRLPVVRVAGGDLRLDLGSAGDDTTHLLYQVEGAHVLSDGRIVVANRGSHELRYYGSGGRFLHAVGGKGGGPGEFEYLAWTTRCASDTVVTYDIGHRRAQFFDGQGTLARGLLGEIPGGGGPYGPAPCWGDVFSVLAWGKFERVLGYHRPPQVLMSLDADWKLVSVLDTVPGAERWGREHDDRPAYFGRTPAHAIGPDGIHAGTADRYEYRQFAADGRLLRIVRWHATPLAVTAAHIRQLREREVARGAITERAFAEIPLPDSLPAYQRFLMSLTGELWVQDYQPPGDSVQWWTVFSGNGRALSRVELPPGLYAFEIGRDHVVGRWRDELDVEHVRVYRLGT